MNIQRFNEIADKVQSGGLIVDLDQARSNQALMEGGLEQLGSRLRPHFKAHKCTQLLKLQASDQWGVTCATAWEAATLVGAGFQNILVANETIDSQALKALTAVAARARVTLAIDHVDQIKRLSDWLEPGMTLGVLLDIDVGMHRCGVPAGSDDLIRLAMAVADAPGLELEGIMAYGGHVASNPVAEARQSAFSKMASLVADDRNRLEARGFACNTVSGGGTGDYLLAAGSDVYTEIQAGSYILMDRTYGNAEALPFQQAVFCVARVLSMQREQVVLDAGLKSMSAEKGPPGVLGDLCTVERLHDEHSIGTIATGEELLVGATVGLVPGHLDPTMNLHDRVYVADGSDVTVWDIDGRSRFVS